LHLDDHDQAFHRACRISSDDAALQVVASALKPAWYHSSAKLTLASPPIQAARGIRRKRTMREKAEQNDQRPHAPMFRAGTVTLGPTLRSKKGPWTTLAAAIWLVFSAPLSPAAEYMGRVVSVADGDTFAVRIGSSTVDVRLCGIDSQERGHARYMIARTHEGPG
jgi:endonuclease YncB( thermonuclease family)